MYLRRTLLSTALAALAVVGGAAHAASTPPDSGDTPLPCSPPGPVTCLSNSWVRSCGAQFGATDPNNQASPCWSYSKAAQENWLNTQQQGNPTERVFESSSNNFLAAMPSPTVPIPDSRTGTNATWAAQEDRARYNAFHTFYPYSPLDYQRMYDTATWTEIKTCENYVYRSFYDVERWIDSVNMCKGNPRCVVNVSLNGMTATGPATVPGIARRKMKDADGYVIYDPSNANSRGRQLLSKGMVTQLEVDPFDDRYTLGNLPKNMFYANTQSFMVPSLMAAFQASGKASHIQDLANEINRGSTLYEIGDSHTAGTWFMANNRAHQGFYDEWDFHNTMNQRTSTVTHGEAKEYRRRAEALRAQYDLLIDEMKCMLYNVTHPGGCNGNIPNAIGKVKPGEAQMWEGDPFAVRQIFNSVAPEAFLNPPALQGQIGYGSRLEVGQYTLSQIIATPLISSTAMIPDSAHLPGMLQLEAPALTGLSADSSGARTGTTTAMSGGSVIVIPLPVIYPQNWTPSVDLNSTVPFGSLAWFLNLMWQGNAPVVDTSSPYPKLLCNIRRLNTDTYNSQKIWLDACKLTNMLLEEWARLKQGKPSCFDRNSYACDWLPEDFVDRFVTKNVGYMASAKEAEYRWCKRWTGGGQLTSTNPVIGVPAGNRITLHNLRVTLHSRQANFEALLKKVPVKANDDFGTLRTDSQHIGNDTFGGGYSYSLGWHAKVLQRSDSGDICRMGGNASATFAADATLFGIDDISIIDARAAVSSNEDNSGQAYGDAKLYVVGYQIFDSDPDGSGQHINLTAGWTRVAIDGGKPELFSVPFQAGPVTITVTAGISYNYGVIANFNAAPPAAGCDPAASIFKVGATFTPFADLGVWADADASLAGIVGVGLEVELTLVGLNLPLSLTVKLGTDTYQNVTITFDAGLDLTLTTLKGELSLYIKALFMKVASFTLVSWDGFRHNIPLFRTHETLLLSPLQPGTITPPTPGGDT
ncbi:hypothetical protein [Archangium sp.]|uniref:hypothetical protein n=1 Tax=Archangium sp. TaxID=1872627 RepID=UPI002D640A0F|nr:hypothetical protein [Archangium sp.]HYO56185.1 hypothetical protein [Archangium sp.]